MSLDYLIKGILLGLAIAAPVGPIGLLCIRRTITGGRWSGFFSGLGAAVADLIYAVVAAFGLTLISDFLIDHRHWLQTVGGLFLIYLGFNTFRAQPGEVQEIPHRQNLLMDFTTSFLLTITNPMTIFSYLAVFAGLGLGYVGESRHLATLLVSGVFIGSALWWTILAEGVTFFRKKVSPVVLKWINRGAGLLLLGFGIAAIIAVYTS